MDISTEPSFQRHILVHVSLFYAENIKSVRNEEDVSFHLHGSSPKIINGFLPNSLLVTYTKTVKNNLILVMSVIVSHILHESRLDFIHIPKDALYETKTRKYKLHLEINEYAVFAHRRLS
jgi:hypothetical protein